MHGTRLRRPLLVCPLQLFTDPFDEPALVGHRHRLDVAIQESSIVSQEEGWFEEQLFSIFRLKAKET